MYMYRRVCKHVLSVVVNDAARLSRYACNAHVSHVELVYVQCMIVYTCIVQPSPVHPLLSMHPFRTQALTAAMTTSILRLRAHLYSPIVRFRNLHHATVHLPPQLRDPMKMTSNSIQTLLTSQ